MTDHKASLRMTAPLVLVLLVLSSVLIALRIEQVLLEFAQARSLRAAHQVRDQIEGGFRLGLSLSDQTNLGEWLRRQAEEDSALAGAQVLTDSGSVVAEHGQRSALAGVKPVWTAQLLGQGSFVALPSISRHEGRWSYVGMPVADPSGQRSALIWLAYDRASLRDSAWSVMRALWPWALALALALVLALTALAATWLRWVRARLDAAQDAACTDTDEQRARQPDDMVRLVEQRAGRGGGRDLLLLALAFALSFGALGVLAWKARDIARPLLLAQIDQSAQTVLRMSRGHIERALKLGIPPEGLVGVEAMFASELVPAPEIAFLALRTDDGRSTAFSPRDGSDPRLRESARAWIDGRGDGSDFRHGTLAVHGADGQRVGELLIGTPRDYVDQRVRSILLDLLFAIIVSVVLVREALGGAWERSVLKPALAFETAWQGWLGRVRLMASGAQAGATVALDWLGEVRSGVRRLAQDMQARLTGQRPTGVSMELVRIRLLVFLTALSEELLRPFFAVFASEVQPPSLALSPAMLAGLPVATFMLTLALAQPMGPWVTRRVDIRRAMAVVAVVGAALLAATAWARDAAVLMALRAGSGVAYGLLLILAQTLIVRITDSAQRARGLVEVSAAIVAAGVCGPALGGLLAERLGPSLAFVICGLCLAAAAVVALVLAPLPATARGNLAGLGGFRGIAAVLRHRHVMSVTWFAAVPARLAAAALLVVVTPLYLQDLGVSSTVTGRVLLLYFLAFMLTAPLVARWSDLARTRKPWIVWGCVLSAASCAAFPVLGGVAGAAVCCVLLGVGQAVLSAPQLALVTETFDRDPHATQIVGATPEQALAAFRFIERFGSVIAPFVVAGAVAVLGLGGAVGLIGLLLFAGALGVVAGLWNLKEAGQGHGKN